MQLKVLAGLIPWVDIINAAPQILSAAKDMMDSTAKSRAETPEPPLYNEKQSDDETIKILRNETVRLRHHITELKDDVRRQALLIERIAEHDQQITRFLEVVRLRLIYATGISLVSLLGMAACLIILFAR